MKSGGTAALLWGAAALVAAVLVGLAYIGSGPEGDSSTDAAADSAAGCLTRHPMPDNAAGFARDELNQCGGWDVIEYTDIGDRLAEPEKPSVRLVIRVHRDEQAGLLFHEDAINACYRMEFNFHGRAGGTSRVKCPPGAPALLPPGVQRHGVPDGYAEAFKAALSALPPTPTRDEVFTAVDAKLPPLPIDEHGQPWRAPRLDAVVENGEIGVIADGGRDKCLEGVRLADGTVTVEVAEPSNTTYASGGCDPSSALSKR
ncbi:hypothetical protein [Lentzea sp. NPDC051838]|uniref:hypothetical protein n=1 Tax=Lentzea sp. NPDC051838 TaxID=3154849 RepID=UPI00343A4E5B